MENDFVKTDNNSSQIGKPQWTEGNVIIHYYYYYYLL